jgi:hypothetical protein
MAITKKFNIPLDSNISQVLYKELLSAKYPLVKKKAFFEEDSRLKKNELYCSEMIKKMGNPEWNLNVLIEELDQMKNDQKAAKSKDPVKKLILFFHHRFSNFNGKQQ